MYSISVYADKGGTGKSTITKYMAQALGVAGKKVLIIDNDPQGDVSTFFGINDSALSRATIDSLNKSTIERMKPGTGLSEIFKPSDIPMVEIIGSLVIETDSKGIYIITPGLDLRNYQEIVGVDIGAIEQFMYILKTMYTDHFDYILIDNPPGQKVNISYFAEFCERVIIPTSPEDTGLDSLQRTYGILEHTKNFKNTIVSIVVNKLMPNVKFHEEFYKLFLENYHGRNGNTQLTRGIMIRADIQRYQVSEKSIYISASTTPTAIELKEVFGQIFPEIGLDGLNAGIKAIHDADALFRQENFKKIAADYRFKKKTNISQEV